MIKGCPHFRVLDRALHYVIKTGVLEVFHLCFILSLHSPFTDEEFLDVHFCHSLPHHHGRVVFGLFGPFCPTLPLVFLETFPTQQSRIHLPITASAPHGLASRAVRITTARWSVNAAILVSAPHFCLLRLRDAYILTILEVPRLVYR